MSDEKKLKNVKIGYASAAIDRDHPAVRRRFGYYAQKRDVQFEQANPTSAYDVVVVHHSADLTMWSSYEKGKIIFDYNDDYLNASPKGFKARIKGLAKYVTGQYSKLEIDFTRAYMKMIRRADAVIYSTDAQLADVRPHCTNAYKIVDMQSDGDWMVKKDYKSGPVVNLVWEGLPALAGLESILPVLQDLKARIDFSLHLVTAIKWPRYLNHYFPTHTKRKIDRVFPFKGVFLYEWVPSTFSNIVTACDLAIIPIPMHDPFWVGKPANKLLFFWRMAMPVLTSPTPEYTNVMKDCGVDMSCHNADDWKEKLTYYMKDSLARAEAGTRGKRFVDDVYGNDRLLSLWDRAVISVL